MVVDGRHQENAPSLAASAFGIFEIGDLHHNRNALDKKHAAEDRQQQFLANTEGEDGDNAADGQRSRITHEGLGGKGVIPQEPDRRPDKRSNKHHQLTRMWNIHDIQVIRIHHITRHVRQNTQCRSYDSRSPRCQTVQPIRQIRPVTQAEKETGYYKSAEVFITTK